MSQVIEIAIPVEELEARGVLFAALQEEVGSAFDPFDLVCHIAYDKPPLTRKERADAVRKRDVFGRQIDFVAAG